MWGEVRAGNVFQIRLSKEDDVWVVLNVKPSLFAETFVLIRYAFIHNLGEFDSVSEFNVDPNTPVDYDPLFDVGAT